MNCSLTKLFFYNKPYLIFAYQQPTFNKHWYQS